MRRFRDYAALAAFCGLFLLGYSCKSACAQVRPGRGFVPLFDGKTLSGWHVSSKTPHGSGGRWEVVDGAIVGKQDPPGQGGILITDKQFEDFELIIDVKPDWGIDSGIFLRSNEQGQCYQVMVDYYAGGNIGGIYGEGLPNGLHHRTYDLNERGEVVPNKALSGGEPLRFKPEDWPRVWKRDDWNRLRIRIWGNPPTITVWLNGRLITEFTDTKKRLPNRGGIALQVHGGGDTSALAVRFRDIWFRALTPPSPVPNF
jgi:hypothetical protein